MENNSKTRCVGDLNAYRERPCFSWLSFARTLAPRQLVAWRLPARGSSSHFVLAPVFYLPVVSLLSRDTLSRGVVFLYLHGAARHEIAHVIACGRFLRMR